MLPHYKIDKSSWSSLGASVNPGHLPHSTPSLCFCGGGSPVVQVARVRIKAVVLGTAQTKRVGLVPALEHAQSLGNLRCVHVEGAALLTR